MNFFDLTVFDCEAGVVSDVFRLNTVTPWTEIVPLNRDPFDGDVLGLRTDDHSLNRVQSSVKSVRQHNFGLAWVESHERQPGDREIQKVRNGNGAIDENGSTLTGGRKRG